MRTGSLRAATQADPGQRATPQKVGSRAREKCRTQLGTLAVRSDCARAQVGRGCGEVPAMRIEALNIANTHVLP